jgi:micrococcal nuclease
MHDFKNFPELTNSQMSLEYMNSPHKQITMDFEARVFKVHDGDTVTLQWEDRDFNFPMRIVEIDAPELNMDGGHEARDYLKGLVEGQLVQIIINPENRVEKWGRLLGDIFIDGLLMSEDMIRSGHAWPFDRRREGQLPNLEKELNIQKWLRL